MGYREHSQSLIVGGGSVNPRRLSQSYHKFAPPSQQPSEIQLTHPTTPTHRSLTLIMPRTMAPSPQYHTSNPPEAHHEASHFRRLRLLLDALAHLRDDINTLEFQFLQARMAQNLFLEGAKAMWHNLPTALSLEWHMQKGAATFLTPTLGGNVCFDPPVQDDKLEAAGNDLQAAAKFVVEQGFEEAKIWEHVEMIVRGQKPSRLRTYRPP
jgi:hypothetical protein